MISLILSASLSKANAQISISHQIMPSLFLTHSLNKCDDQDHRINISLSPLFSVLFLSLTSPCTPPLPPLTSLPTPTPPPSHPHKVKFNRSQGGPCCRSPDQSQGRWSRRARRHAEWQRIWPQHPPESGTAWSDCLQSTWCWRLPWWGCSAAAVLTLWTMAWLER